MISVLNEDNFLAVRLLAKVHQVHESSFGKLLDVDVTKPDDKVFSLLVLKAGEAPEGTRSVQTNARINFEEFAFFSLDLEKCLKS